MTLSQLDARASIALSDGMEAVLLPVRPEQIVRTYRDGDHLVVALADGRELLLEGWFARLEEGREVSLLARDGSTGEIVAVIVTETGEYAGSNSVALGRLEEMFGGDADSMEEALRQAGVSAQAAAGAIPAELVSLMVVGGTVLVGVTAIVVTAEDSDGEETGPIITTIDADGSPASETGGAPAGRSYDVDRDGTIDRYEYFGADGSSVVRVEHDDDDNGTIDRTAHDANGDGNPERIVHDADSAGVNVRRAFDADDNGSIDRTEHDADGDGTAERTVHDSDSDGTDVRTVFDADDNGVTDRVEVDANSDGNLERIEYGFDTRSTSADPDVPITTHPEFTLLDSNSDGSTDSIRHDANVDGTLDSIEDFVYGDGLLVTRSVDNNGAIGDGSYEEVETYTYTDGLLTRIAFDLGESVEATARTPVLDSSNQPVLDAENNPLEDISTTTTRGTVDGSPDRHEDFAYENDLLTTKSIDSSGTIGDGTYETVESYFYSDDGDLIRTEYDIAPNNGTVDGSADRIRYHYVPGGTEGEYTVDIEYSSGRVSARRFDTDFSNIDTQGGVHVRIFERTEEYTYHSNGTMSEERIDLLEAGVSMKETHTYDNTGARLRSEYDTNADGSPDRVEDHSTSTVSVNEYSYNDAGALTGSTQSEDTNGDGNFETETSYDATGAVLSIKVYQYDSDGVAIGAKVYADQAALGSDTAASIETYMYGTVHEGISTWDDVHLRTEFDTDANGSIDRVEHYDLNGGIERVEDWTWTSNTLTIKYASWSGTTLYDREKEIMFTSDANGTTVTSVVDREYNLIDTNGVWTRELRTTKTDSDGDGLVDSVAMGSAAAVTYTRMEVEFDTANSLSYNTVGLESNPFSEIWFPAVGDYSFEPDTDDGTAWQNVDTIALYNKDDTDGDFAGGEGRSGDATLILTDEFIDALMTGRGNDDHVMIWGDEGDTVQINLSRYAIAIQQYAETHQWFEILDIDGVPVTKTSAPDDDGETVTGPGRLPKQFEALLAIDNDIDIVDLPAAASSDTGSLVGDTALPI